MKTITLIWKKMFAVVVLLCCASMGFAQDQTWKFDANETADYAAFFKQPSAIEGKCNAEVMGIDINREGFSWDDMNTWLNAEGVIWRSYKPDYSETVFGVNVNSKSPFGGKTSSLSWTNTDGDNKWYPALPGVVNLKGKLVLRDCKATVIHISNTQMDTVKIEMTNTDNDCYLHVRRNPNVKQIDLSGSTGKCRQLAGYKNALSDETALLCIDCPKKEFLDWMLNLEDNCYTYSTMPLHPATGKVLGSGYKLQWSSAGGFPVGMINNDGEYEIEIDEDIDLSAEYDVLGKITTYTWKDEDGSEITPTSADATGWFSFGEECVGKYYRCEMSNEAYPALALNTVFVKVVKSYSTSGLNNTLGEEMIKVGPNPADDFISIMASDIQNVKVYSQTGACVKNVDGTQHVINIADLSSGLYFVKVTTLNGENVVKLIKK